ncbi:hypothetical protein [Lysobacter capsici]|uniref:hypothetical protein n=1 Tax=Lysobacter capsici TaxID=435897 RepID=UPI001BFFFFE4|nr:hypothetical protein [Lysobacter capsici]QWF17057.1 hypothetical protein KME82_25565 [Lysobacter capsici]
MLQGYRRGVWTPAITTPHRRPELSTRFLRRRSGIERVVDLLQAHFDRTLTPRGNGKTSAMRPVQHRAMGIVFAIVHRVGQAPAGIVTAIARAADEQVRAILAETLGAAEQHRDAVGEKGIRGATRGAAVSRQAASMRRSCVDESAQ